MIRGRNRHLSLVTLTVTATVFAFAPFATAPLAAQDSLSDEDKRRLAASESGEGGDTATNAVVLSLPYRDAFDGRKLGGTWEPVNPKLDQFVVENGGMF